MNVLKQDLSQTQASALKAFLEEEGARIRDAHFAGAGGSEVVQRRTALIDLVLRDAHSDLSAAGPMPALLAVGGYGRGELNPHSDIDLMLLCRNEEDRKRSPELLYLLWDAGLDVGYSVRTVSECVALSRQDSKIRTSLTESRLIAGDRALYGAFLQTMRSEVFFWKAASFVQEKISERTETRRKFGGSLYLREPNIKEGTGGLRDFHTALWVAFVHFKVSSLGDLAANGVLSEGQYAVFRRSRNFLWRIRNGLHYLSGRKNDHLTFDLQERVAKDFRFRDSAHLLAVERFMKAYFLHARNVREFTALVTDAALRNPEKRWYTRTVALGPFTLVGRTLIPSREGTCEENPALIMTAFELAQARHATLSDKLKSLIRRCRIDDGVRSSPPAASAFLAILNNPDRLFETLTLMKDLRFLGRYLPEFRAVQSLAKHDYYHTYTVDEHTLFAIRALQDLWAGNYPALTTLSEAFQGLQKQWVLMLAVLLHDLGKAYRFEHEHRGVPLAESVLTRIGLDDVEKGRILFLIRNHLLMSGLSQRRELTDDNVISDFARTVRDRENLSMLYLLTYADISAVNPTAWTQWKAALLQELYLKTMNRLDKSRQATEAEHALLIAASVRVREAAEGLFQPREIDDFLIAMPEQYILNTPVHNVIDHMGMMKKLPAERLVIRHRHYPEKGFTELTVCAYDAYGMFFRTVGTLAAKRLNILRAQVYTAKNGIMLDTLQITDSEGKLYSYEDAWAGVAAELRSALTSGSRPPEPGLSRYSDVLHGTITPSVDFDNDTSDTFTIIDVTARDKVGFLYQVAKALYDLNLDIASAKITTEGVKAMDSFYVTDLLRNKITDDARLAKIREHVVKVLTEGASEKA